MSGKVYFGNKTKQVWIKAPNSGMKATSAGYVSEAQLLNGGTYIDRSTASHRKFSSTWTGSFNTSDISESLHTIKDFSDGLYGDGPFYWVDPFASAQNIMPPHWAAPMLAEKGWTNLTNGVINPVFAEGSTSNNYPLKYATYATTNGFVSTNKLVLIIPTGYKLAFGWHGPASGSSSGVRIVPYKRSNGTADPAINPARITTGAATRTNTNVSGTTYSYVEIFIATDTASTVSIAAMVAQIIPETSSVANGTFISGRGTTSLQFASFPDIDYYSSSINDGWVGMAVDWAEVE